MAPTSFALLAVVLAGDAHIVSANGGALSTLRAKEHLFKRFEHEAESIATPAKSERRLDGNCDSAYYNCLWDSACYACIQELSTTSIDDDFVSDDELDGYSCNQFVDFLHGHGVCSSTTCNDPHLFWTMIDACNEDDSGDDDDYIDEECSATECVVPHEEYLGDGWCDYDTGGCYNSEACGFDHGDCCVGTCVSTASITCGDHGYECIDPTQQTSCSDDTTYTMHMIDAYGDGWNGAAYTIAEIASRVQQATGTLATGTEGTDDVCLLPGCYLMVVSAGSWSTEASWSLDDIASGGAPTQCKFSIDGSFCDNLSGDNAQIPSCGDEPGDVSGDDDCTDNLYQLVLIDQYGDGWNGADYTLSSHGSAGNSGATISTGTLDQGFQTTESVCLPNGCYTMTVASGSWSSEISWEVGSPSAGLVATSGAPVSCDFPVGGTFCASTCHPVAVGDDDGDDDDFDGWYYYYESSGDDTCLADDQGLFTVAMSDAYGDGWNGASYSISELMSGASVKSGTLTSGNYAEDHVCLNDDVCYSVLLSQGSYDDEVTWEIGKYGVGMIGAGAGANAPAGCQFSTNDFCTTTCVVANDNDDSSSGACSGMPGSGSSYSLMLYDSAGDGWNGAGYTVTNKNSGQAESSGTLSAGMSSQEDMCLPVGCYSLEVDSGGHADEVSWFLGDAGISGGAPSTCQFSVGNPVNCPSYCEVDEDDNGGGGGGGGGHHHCNTAQSIAGASTIAVFQGCSSPHIGADDLPVKKDDDDSTDLALKDWGKLDEFEACALDSTTENWPEACMILLGQAKSSEDKLVKKIAKNLDQAQAFCLCGTTCSAGSPSCNSFHNFNAMLHESVEACNALDAVDCDYLRVYTEKCSSNLVDQFGLMDLSADGQCAFVDDGCGPGVSEPALRHWDCLDTDTMNPVQKTFIEGYEQYCVAGEEDDNKTDDKDISKTDDPLVKTDDHTDKTDDIKNPSEHPGHEGHSSPSQAGGMGATAIVFIVIAVFGALVVCCGGGLYFLKKHRGEGGEGYVLGATTFSPMVFGDKPPVSFSQLKTEVTATELSSGTGTYTPVGGGPTEGV